MVLSGKFSDILSDIFSVIYSWHIFCHSLPDMSSEIFCGRGQAGITLILSLPFGSGGEHCDLALAVEVRHMEHSDPEFGPSGEHCNLPLAVEVRQGAQTLILSLLFASGGEHCVL